MVVEEALDKLCPVFFVRCYLKPILERTLVNDDNFGDFREELSEIANDHILVMKVGEALIALVLAAGGEHAAGRVVNRPLDNFPKEAKLPGSDHVLNAWYVIEHAAYLLILEMLFPYICDGDVKDPPNAAMEEDFEAAEEVLSQGPVLASPEEKIHQDHSKK